MFYLVTLWETSESQMSLWIAELIASKGRT
jgi:hypothetical protein